MTTFIPKLWIDDIRPAPEGWIHLKTSQEVIDFLTEVKEKGNKLDIISFDHDLGGDDTTRPVVRWMAEHEFWPFPCLVPHCQSSGSTVA